MTYRQPIQPLPHKLMAFLIRIIPLSDCYILVTQTTSQTPPVRQGIDAREIQEHVQRAASVGVQVECAVPPGHRRFMIWATTGAGRASNT